MNRKQEIIQLALKGAYIGIGISLIFTLIFSGVSQKENTFIGWLVLGLASVFFGFIVGFLISLTNVSVNSLLNKFVPIYRNSVFIQSLVGLLVNFLVFYTLASIFLPIYWDVPQYLFFYISLGTALASIMVNFFFKFMEEKEAKLRLEQENRRLAVIEERNRIAQDLHDSVSQNLFGISLNLNSLAHLINNNPEKAQEMVVQLQGMVQEIQNEMRLMIHELKPVSLQEKGFLEAVENLLSLFSLRFQLDIEYDLQGEEDNLSAKAQLTFYRIIQEALHNVVRHAAASKVELKLVIEPEKTELLIKDNGQGFNWEDINWDKHFGIKGMQERVQLINGQLDIKSKPGQGTVLRVYLKQVLQK